MSIDPQAYQRVRRQVLFLLNIVELLADTVDSNSGAAKSARRAVELIQKAFSAAELTAEAYASIANDIDDVLQQVARLKAERRPASNVEWEALRSAMEAASARISAAVDLPPQSIA